jgi:proton glutamate symport protein
MSIRRLRLSQTQLVLLAMIAGVAVGHFYPDTRPTGFHATDLQVLSNMFLRMIKSLIAPLIFSTLVVGFAGHGGDLKRVGRLAFRSILYFEFATTLAMIVGLVVVNIVKPGVGVSLPALAGNGAGDVAATPLTVTGMLEHAVPQSFVDAAARNDSLQIVVFTILFAIGVSQLSGPMRTPIMKLCESLAETMFKVISIVMKLAPIAIGAALAATVGRNGLGVVRSLGMLVLSLYGSLVIFALLVLLPIAGAFGVPVRRFIAAVKEPWMLAFSTASSEAALPLAFKKLEQIGVPRSILSFVLPAGYTFNMDGTTLYLAMASIFVAQAAGINMPISQQVLMMVTLMLTSKGVAAVPRSSLVVLSAALVQFGLPIQGVALILGVDAFMDMARTSINVVGNCLAAVLMARWEGVFDVPVHAVAVVDVRGGTVLHVPAVSPSARSAAMRSYA